MRALFIVFLVLLVTGCSVVSKDEVAWAKSPDGGVHAILLETNGGATTSFGYLIELHLADHGGERPTSAGSIYGAARSDCAYGVDLRWLSANALALRLDRAEKIDVPRSVGVGGRTVRLVVQTGVKNADAPCGGMLANRSTLNGS